MPVPASELWERRGDIFAAALRPQAVRETTTATGAATARPVTRSATIHLKETRRARVVSESTAAAEALPQVGEALWRSRGALMERLLREHLTR